MVVYELEESLQPNKKLSQRRAPFSADWLQCLVGRFWTLHEAQRGVGSAARGGAGYLFRSVVLSCACLVLQNVNEAYHSTFPF
jgi:hypothetical protein